VPWIDKYEPDRADPGSARLMVYFDACQSLPKVAPLVGIWIGDQPIDFPRIVAVTTTTTAA